MITIVNYGLGNINAFANVYKNLNVEVKIACSTNELKGASKLILPGVGSFDQAMMMLQQSGMKDSLDELVIQKRIPVLGICVGMQMLAHASEEGTLPGLSWIDGSVKKFVVNPDTWLPHMGWNTIEKEVENPLLQDLGHEARFYFLHSYYFSCNNISDSISTTYYGMKFTSAVNKENIYGVQFHPEKSHRNGIQVLYNFSRL